ncbi:MAG: prepilin-type N-terminal cleavage/methylation domain-containing protein [Deltaproteobacteria bacterium]|nr:prepilin-type N-terminal cleavage/methylation domain-containing protein [Deltaproteobacteria bacterium]
MLAAEAKRFRLSLIKRKDGFTLNEILISVALIGIGVLGFSVNTIGVIQGNYISSNFTIATNLAQEKMEEVKARTSFSNDTVTDSVTGASGITFTRTCIISDFSGTDLKEVEVRVSWTAYLISHQLTLKTLIYIG